MIDRKNRLCKLLVKSKTFEEFMRQAVSSSHWYLSPYVQAGENVNRPWIESFWSAHKK